MRARFGGVLAHRPKGSTEPLQLRRRGGRIRRRLAGHRARVASMPLPDHRNDRTNAVPSQGPTRGGRGGVQKKEGPLSHRRTAAGIRPAGSQNDHGDLSNHQQSLGRPSDPSPLLQPKLEVKTFPVCTIVGVVEFGMEGEKPTRVSRLDRLSGIPSPAAGFRRRALFQEAASRQLRASLAPSATTIARSGPFGPTAPPHNIEAELRTRNRGDLAYGIS